MRRESEKRKARVDVHYGGNMTQLDYARANEITKEMREVSEIERIEEGVISEEIKRGRMIIPANINHTRLKPMGIGRILTTKINANIGMSAVSASVDEELEKLQYSIQYGADTVMDLSTGGNLDEVRVKMIKESPIPIGTVPLYQAVVDQDILNITKQDMLDVIEKQAKQGVDYMTIHCGILKDMIPLTKDRVMGIVSRGGALIAKWMTRKEKENPLYEAYEEILEILHEYDVTISLGDSLRPGCIEDATDEAQIAELKELGKLTKRAWAKGVQVMVEGPGHIPLDQIQKNMDLQKEYCHEAPFYVLGPLVTDIAPGYDHITSSIGATLAAYHGASFLCYVTPKEHLGLPNKEDVRAGIIAYKIAAHASDIARGIPGAKERDKKLSEARFKFDWQAQYDLSLDPEKAKSMREEGLAEDKEFCSMCGPNFCSIKVTNDNLEKIRQKH